MAWGKPFGYKQDPYTCLWCGDGLKFTRVWEEPGANLRAQVVAAFDERKQAAEALAESKDEWCTYAERAFKHPDLGWIDGGASYPRVYNGTVTVGPRGIERQQREGKPGTVTNKDDHFCSGMCAQEFGRRACELGYRLQLTHPEENA